MHGTHHFLVSHLTCILFPFFVSRSCIPYFFASVSPVGPSLTWFSVHNASLSKMQAGSERGRLHKRSPRLALSWAAVQTVSAADKNHLATWD